MILVNLLLALAWAALTGQFTIENFLVGCGLGYLVLWLTHRADAGWYFRKVVQVVRFGAYIVYELVAANLTVAWTVLLTPRARLRPGIVAVPLSLTSDAQITLLAYLITLTPGTVTLDISSDRRVLFMHTLAGTDPERVRRVVQEGFERRIREVFE
jgi:multicomponent Na+:H+ antiporter subunit E